MIWCEVDGVSRLLLSDLEKLRGEYIKKLNKIKKNQQERPSEDYFAVHKEFQELLDNHTGKARLANSFKKKIDALAEREKVAKRKMFKKVTIGQIEKDIDTMLNIEQAISELESITWMYKKRKEY